MTCRIYQIIIFLFEYLWSESRQLILKGIFKVSTMLISEIIMLKLKHLFRILTIFSLWCLTKAEEEKNEV